MNIAIYYPWIYLTSGIERTVLETCKIKGHQYTIFTHHFDQKNTFPEFNRLNIVQLNKAPVKRGILSVLKAATTIATQKINLNEFNLLIVHSDGLGDLILNRNHSLPTICICHTPLRPVFDEYYRKEILKNKPTTYKLSFHTLAQIFKYIDQRLWQHYQHIFFNSQETLKRAQNGNLLKHLQTNQYEILHPGINWQTIKPSYTFKPYFLLPGRIMWTKNIQLAIKAFIKFKSNHPQLKHFKLIIAGRVDHKSQTYLQQLSQLTNNRNDIKFIINPTNKQLNRLYQNCWAVLSSAFNEDWGLTLIEGNAHGKPTIAINRGGPTESQIQNKTAFLVSPTTTNYAQTLHILANNLQLTKEMGSNARKHSKKYNWNKFQSTLNSKITECQTQLLL